MELLQTEYQHLCQILGSSNTLVQGSGGNVSVKEGDKLLIKASGTRLRDNKTALCSLQGLREWMALGPEGQAAERTKAHPFDPFFSYVVPMSLARPSMEVFFHMLPFRWVIHLHPTWLLRHLCSASWKDLELAGHVCAYIPYTTPGEELGRKILETFDPQNPQTVWFLQNHGVILCAETVEEGLAMLDQLTETYSGALSPIQYKELWDLQTEACTLTGRETVLSVCSHLRELHDRYFLPITPDIQLFLRNTPLAIEEPSINPIEALRIFWAKTETLPAVFKLPYCVCILGSSVETCLCTEEILESYLEIVKGQRELLTFDEAAIHALQTSEAEQYRLSR